MNALLAYVTASDFRLSGRVCAWCPPRWCRLWMVGATRLGDGWLWALTAVLLPATGRFDLLAAAAVAAALANASVILLKRRFRRPRPHGLFGIAAPSHFVLDRFSFPSGHSLNAFALCGVLSPAFPAFAPLFGLMAGSVAASRVVLGLHYLSDVVVGTLAGALLGAAAYGLVVG